jgi:hypothetical protein
VQPFFLCGYLCVYIFYVPFVSYIGSSLQACIAMSPDQQLNILKDMWRKQKSVEVAICKEDNETIKYYLNKVR